MTQHSGNTHHDLKCHSQYFSMTWDNKKLFEFRLNDRNYQVGDGIILRECDIDPATGEAIFSGRVIGASITCVLDKSDFEPVRAGWVILGIEIEYLSPDRRFSGL